MSRQKSHCTIQFLTVNTVNCAISGGQTLSVYALPQTEESFTNILQP